MGRNFLLILLFLAGGFYGGIKIFKKDSTSPLSSVVIATQSHKEIRETEVIERASGGLINSTKQKGNHPKPEDPFLSSINSEIIREALKVSFRDDNSSGSENYEEAIEILNQDPNSSLNEISKEIILIPPDKDGIRNHLVNLAMQTDAIKSVKAELLTNFLMYSKFNISQDNLSEDSLSASVAIDYLGQVFPTQEEAQSYLNDILSIENEKVRAEFSRRLKAYYPNL